MVCPMGSAVEGMVKYVREKRQHMQEYHTGTINSCSHLVYSTLSVPVPPIKGQCTLVLTLGNFYHKNNILFQLAITKPPANMVRSALLLCSYSPHSLLLPPPSFCINILWESFVYLTIRAGFTVYCSANVNFSRKW